jgi:hypothetical protein
MESIIGALRSLVWRISDYDPTSYAEVLGPMWERARRERQMRPFIVDPSGLVSHGLEPIRKDKVTA